MGLIFFHHLTLFSKFILFIFFTCQKTPSGFLWVGSYAGGFLPPMVKVNCTELRNIGGGGGKKQVGAGVNNNDRTFKGLQE
jgi:hypothetical protein